MNSQHALEEPLFSCGAQMEALTSQHIWTVLQAKRSQAYIVDAEEEVKWLRLIYSSLLSIAIKKSMSFYSLLLATTLNPQGTGFK